jgi:hypothetical protein
MSQIEFCARASANPLQQGLSACRSQFNARGDRAIRYFRTALPAKAPGKFFPGW